MNKQVLILRDPERASALKTKLCDKGVDVFTIPATQTEFLDANLNLSNLSEYDWLAFTSVNGVKGFLKIMENQKITFPADIKIAAVGEGTANYIADKIRQVDLISQKADGESLANTILEAEDKNTGAKLLWPCGESALDKFQQQLENGRISVDKIVCYRTISVNSDNLQKELNDLHDWDLAVFAAPSAVKSFSSAWNNKDSYIAFAIGPTTAKSLEKAGYKNIITSDGVGVDESSSSILKALQNGILK